MKRNTTARLQSADSQTKRFGIEMLTPTMIILIIMTAYPLIFTLIYSFTDYNYLKGTDKASFILFKNYIKLFKNDYFRQAVLNTIKFTVLAVILEMGLGLLVAVFINSLKRGQKIMRTLLLLPYLLPAVTVALSWRMMLSSNYGIINQFLESLGLPWYNWFLDTKTAFGAILLIDVWQNTPFVFLLLFASAFSAYATAAALFSQRSILVPLMIQGAMRNELDPNQQGFAQVLAFAMIIVVAIVMLLSHAVEKRAGRWQ